MFAKFSVKKPYTVIVGIILVIALGVISFMNMTTDLLPSMDLPYVMVYTGYTGATPEKVETDVSRPMEAAFSTLTDIKAVSSTSSENLSLVVMEFESGADMNTAMIEINSEVEQLSGGWDDSVGTPVIMKLNPDMLPVTISTVSLQDADLLELSDYVQDELISKYEAVDGVARVTASGVLTQQVDIEIEQSRIDVINNAILREVDEELADVELELRDAMSQISAGKSQLGRARKTAYAQIDEALAAIEAGSQQMPMAIETLTAQKAELTLQLEAAKAALAQLEGLVNLSDDEKTQMQQLAEALAALEEQRAQLQAQLDNLQDTPPSALQTQLQDALSARDELLTLKASLEQYIQDLMLLDADSLRETIARLEAEIAANEAEIAEVRAQLETAIANRDAAQLEVNDLNARIGAMLSGQATAEPTLEPTLEPTEEPTAEPTVEPTEIPATDAPETEAPATDIPETDAPETEAPATDIPETEAPETEAPATDVPETDAPATENPTETPAGEDAQPTPTMDVVQDATLPPTSAPATDEPVLDVPITVNPTATPTTDAPTAEPTESATEEPTAEPTESATEAPTAEPTESATEEPTAEPTESATEEPTAEPTESATEAPTAEPTESATEEPTAEPTESAAEEPTESATEEPSGESTESATDAPATEAPATEAPATDVPETETPATEAPATEAPATEAPEEEEKGVFGLLDNFFGGAQAEGESLEELQAKLADAESRLARHQAEVEALSTRHDALRETLNEQAAALDEARESLAILEDGEITVESRIEAARQQLESCNARIAELDAEIATLTAAIEQGGMGELLTAQLAQIDAQIAAIKESEAYQAYLMLADADALQAQYLQAQTAVAQLEAGILSMDEMLTKLQNGILPGGLIDGIDEDTNLAEARQQLLDARDQVSSALGEASSKLKEAEQELNEAWKEFTENRDEALENAGIDGIITVETISGILGSQNLDLPAGYVSNVDDRYLVAVGTEFASLEELKQVKLFSLGMETVDDVRLLDVASVEISDNSADLFTFVNGENGIMLSFEKQSTASTAEVAENITIESERLMAENPRLQVTEMMNQGDYINLIVDSVLDNLISGGVLAIAILLLFLLDWRPTLIVALSIPASVVVAFVCMYFCGVTLNVMSLSGLAIGIGMLVDNSIVSIENIYRLRDEEGLPILTASIRGVNQVAGALFSSTLTTICVFLPVVFVEGMARDLFSDMGLTIAFSLLASLLVAMTVVPSFAAGLLKKKKNRKQRIFGAIQRVYCAMLRGALKVKLLVLLAAVGLLAFTVVQVMEMPISFMPSVNSEQMSASLAFEDPDMTDGEREAIALEIMEGMLDVKGVNDIALTGSDSGGVMSMMGGAGYTYYVLVDMESGRSNSEIADDLTALAEPWTRDESAVFTVQVSTMDLSAFAGSGITINIFGDDTDDMRTAAKELAAICAQVEGAINIDDGAATTEPKLMVTVDKELASDHSLSVAQVYQYIAQRLYGAVELTNATLDGREYTLYVSEDKNSNLAPEDIEDMEIEVEGTDSTEFVRIGDIAEITYGESFSSISRANQKRTTAVSFEIAEGYSANLVSRDLEALLDTYQPPEDCEISLAGENESVMEYMSDLGLMLVVALLFIFLIMVAQFQSFKSPFIVMFTIPLAFTGGLLALIITGMDLSIIAMVGFLVLSGVVVNNGIVFVDSVNQMRIAGMSKKEALVETGRIRLRPILMTALTTILGMSTMALAQGMGAEMMQPMAVVIVGGLAYSTLMTLFVVPVLYDIFNGNKMKAREIEMMKEAAGMARAGFDDEASAPAMPAPASPAPAAEEIRSEEPAAPAKPAPASPAPAAEEICSEEPATPAAPAAPAKPASSGKRIRIRL